MAKINVQHGHFNMGDLADMWNAGSPVLEDEDFHQFNIVDPDTERRLEFKGDNIEYDTSGTPLLGVIEKISYYNIDGSLAWTMDGLKVDAADFVAAANGSAFLTPTALQTFLSSTAFSFRGGLANDTFIGGERQDVINGGDGADIITGNFERDRLSGGGVDSPDPTNMDVLDYSKEKGGDEIHVDLGKGTVVDTSGFTDKVSGFEIIIGTSSLSPDTFQAAAKDVFQGFVGGLGNDEIHGSTGKHDALLYDRNNTAAVTVDLTAGTATGTGIGTDSVDNIDIVVGSALNDTITGSASDEVITGGAGIDTLDGGKGMDTLDFSFETGAFGATVNLSLGYAVDTFHSGLAAGSANIESIANFENVVGSLHDDVFTGSKDANRLRGEDGNNSLRGEDGNDNVNGGNGNDVTEGGSGNDMLLGGAGADSLEGDEGNDNLDGGGDNDKLNGGDGTDKLTGGIGADVFVFQAVTDTKTGSMDLITDFSQKQGDKIDLSALDAVTGTSGNQAFKFIDGAGFHDKAGELRYDQKSHIISGDIDGDGKGDFAIQIHGNVDLKVDDFIL